MTERAMIISTEDKIEAVHLVKEECSSCTSGCAKIRNKIEVVNPSNHAIKKGSIVLIAANKKVQAIQGIIALFLPFLCSVAGYVFSPSLMKFFGKQISNDERAIFVLLFLVLSSAVVFSITRKHPVPGKPEIIEVL